MNKSNYIHFLGIKEKIDIVFAIDTSSSVDESAFSAIKNLLKASLKLFTISNEDVRVALTVFGGDRIETVKKFTTSQDILLSAIRNVPRVGGSGGAFAAMFREVASLFENEGRIDASTQLIIISTAPIAGADDPGNVIGRLKPVKIGSKERNVQITLIDIGGKVDNAKKALASRDGDIYHLLPSVDQLPKVIGIIEQAASDVLGEVLHINIHISVSGMP